MTPGHPVPGWIGWGLGVAAAACAIGIASAPPLAPESGVWPPRPSNASPGGIPEPSRPLADRLDAIRSHRDYARWLIAREGIVPEEYGAAEEACRAGLDGCEETPAAAELARELRELLKKARERRKARLSTLWGEVHRHLTLRERTKAAAALREIRRVAPDPADTDHRRAALYLRRYCD